MSRRDDLASLYAKYGTGALEKLLSATATAEDFEATMKQIREVCVATPDEWEALERQVLATAKQQPFVPATRPPRIPGSET